MFVENLRRDKKATFLPLSLFVMKRLLSSGLKEFSDPMYLCEIPHYLGGITKVRNLLCFLGVFQKEGELQNEIWTRAMTTGYLLQDFFLTEHRL